MIEVGLELDEAYDGKNSGSFHNLRLSVCTKFPFRTSLLSISYPISGLTFYLLRLYVRLPHRRIVTS